MAKNNKRQQVYVVTGYGVDYIQNDEIHEMATHGITIVGVADFMLRLFNCPVYEIDGVHYPPIALDTQTKIEMLIEDGFIEEYRDK